VAVSQASSVTANRSGDCGPVTEFLFRCFYQLWIRLSSMGFCKNPLTYLVSPYGESTTTVQHIWQCKSNRGKDKYSQDLWLFCNVSLVKCPNYVRFCFLDEVVTFSHSEPTIKRQPTADRPRYFGSMVQGDRTWQLEIKKRGKTITKKSIAKGRISLGNRSNPEITTKATSWRERETRAPMQPLYPRPDLGKARNPHPTVLGERRILSQP
jgi:hypothetical protein